MIVERRRFGIADGLILVAGVGGGLGLVRLIDPNLTLEQIWSAFFAPPDGWSARFAIESASEFCILFVVPFVAAWTLACLLVQLKSPRPRRLRRTAGFLSCLLPISVAAITIAVVGASLGLSRWNPAHPNVGHYEFAQILGGLIAGSSVLSAWATMMLCGIWRAQPTWTDRLGRLTGVAWILVATLSGAYLFLGR